MVPMTSIGVFYLLVSVVFSIDDLVKSRPNAKQTPESKPAVKENIWKPYTGDSPRIAGPCTDEYTCLAARLAETERLALEAIRVLHGRLDDDANGNIDLSESDEFLREELHYEGGHERRQKAFHRNDDQHISVRELWDIWTRSEVHNWTVEQTAEWLVHFVQLPQYVPHFTQKGINGSSLPRLAINNAPYYSTGLGIKDPIHRQKIAVKAMDVVLFGPPKESTSYVKDATLITLLVAALAGAWYTYSSNRNSKQHLSKLMEHMEILSSAEKELQELQLKLQHARQEQDVVLSEKIQLERKLEEGGSNTSLFQADPSAELEIRKLKEEVDILRAELQRAEDEREDRVCWSPPPELQHWLQLTYELEQRVYNKKRLHAEKQLEQAKDACEKLNRKRSSFVASFVSTHGRTIDDVDKSILEARSSLMEVKQDLQERTTRWRQIESLCGFSIATNPGLSYLETVLRAGGLNPSRYVVLNPSRHAASFDDDADDASSLVSSCTAAGPLAVDGRSVAAAGNQRAARKYPLLKRDSSVSLESASALINCYAGNGTSNSTTEIAKTTPVIRQRLNQRENSKDSAFDGSTVSSSTCGEDDAASRSSSLLSASNKPSLPPAKADVAQSVHTSERVSALIVSNAEIPRRSPLLNAKLNSRRSHPVKSPSKDNHEAPQSFKGSQSDSSLDVTFQLAQQAEAESGHEENVSTDSSIPSTDGDGRNKLKKKQRFHFPNFVKRSKNKT